MKWDNRVDILMLPVGKALARHVKDRDARTEIYNRAYEAIINSMGVNDTLRGHKEKFTEQVYRLRIPALSLLWFYEVAETPEKAAKQVGDELGGSYIFSRENWEIELCPIEDLAFVLREARRLRRENNKLFEDKSVVEARIAELETEPTELRTRLAVCESALISMVQQFFYSAEGSNVYSHAFMSAEEEAAAYLVGVGIAGWNDEHHSQIVFPEVKE